MGGARVREAAVDENMSSKRIQADPNVWEKRESGKRAHPGWSIAMLIRRGNAQRAAAACLLAWWRQGIPRCSCAVFRAGSERKKV